MAEFCTCGAQLPEDALFCHKCGKPQRAIVEPEPAPPPIYAPPPAATQPTPPPVLTSVNFQNRIAVRISLIVAVSATVMSFLPFFNWAAAGFFAVFLYRRRTGSLLNVSAGVQLGLMTGVLMCGLFAVLFAAQQLPNAFNGQLGRVLQDQMKNLPSQDPLVQQMMNFIQTGPGLATLLLVSLLMMFLMIICLSMAGGALGAKMVGRD